MELSLKIITLLSPNKYRLSYWNSQEEEKKEGDVDPKRSDGFIL